MRTNVSTSLTSAFFSFYPHHVHDVIIGRRLKPTGVAMGVQVPRVRTEKIGRG